MISGLHQKWTLIFVTLAMANPQIPMPYPIFPQQPMFPIMPGPGPMLPMLPPPPPMPGPGPMHPMLPPPPPMPLSLPMPMHVGIAIVSDEEADKQEKKTTTEKPTTTVKPIKDNIAVAVPMPMPLPMPMSMPAPSPVLFAVPGMMSSVCEKNRKHPNCPPCPPCTCNPCTPSFFSYCSSCHQKCRCRKPEDVPLIPPPKAPYPLPGPAFPMPYPGFLPNAQNFVFVPFVPQMAPHWNDKENSNREFSDSDSCENSHLRKGKIAKKLRPKLNYPNYGVFRRSNRRLDVDRNDNVIAKPVLHFLTPDGKVKMRRPLNKIDASILLSEDDDSMQNMPISDNDFSNKHYQFRSRKGQKAENAKKQILSYEHPNKGRKHLVFRPPSDMLVGNLSVSFNT